MHSRRNPLRPKSRLPTPTSKTVEPLKENAGSSDFTFGGDEAEAKLKEMLDPRALCGRRAWRAAEGLVNRMLRQ